MSCSLPYSTGREILSCSVSGRGQPEALAPAERARVAYVDDTTGRLAFHHPLVRSAIIERSTSADVRQAHQVLAGRRRDDPERLAWHLAEAAVEPDERVAALLQQVAHQHLRRGDAVAATAELLRSGLDRLASDGACGWPRLLTSEQP